MDFGPTAEQDELAAAERSWLQWHSPISRVREGLGTVPVTVDSAAFARAVESGLLVLLLPEMGGSQRDLEVVSEVHGYAASSLPVADLALAVWLTEQAHLPQTGPASHGELCMGVARGPAGDVSGDLLRLHGDSSPVPMAEDMDSVVVIGPAGSTEYVLVLDKPALVTMQTLDVTRSWARLHLEIDTSEWVTVPKGTVDYVRDALAVHRAADAIGAASRLLELSVTYAGQREQFGAAIGSFQAVKHHCADMAIAVEAGRSILWAAAEALDTEGDLERARITAASAAYAKVAASRVASYALQVHGGIGFTWEHDLHLFLRRIKVDEAFDGTVAQHRAALVPTT